MGIHRYHPLGGDGVVAVTTASPGPERTGGAEEFADHLIGG